jgi:hypothetical protein
MAEQYMADNPLVRQSTTCPICDGFKDRHSLACRQCYREGGVRYGDPAFEAKIATRESQLSREAAR